MALKNKYQRQKEQYSTDGGITWLDVTPPNYRKGNVIEMGSDDCNTVEWIEVAGSWFCIGTDTVTRWVIATNEYMCSNGNKYQKEKEQISYDNGVTWSDTGNARTGSLIEADSEDCNYANQYLTFVALEDGTFSFTKSYIQYSLDGGSTWTTLSANTQTPTVTTGNKILWKGTLTPTGSGIGTFNSTGRFDVEGNSMSLLYGDNFVGQTVLTGTDYTFYHLFNNNNNLINANNLRLPATTLTDYCYEGMFKDCTSLTTAPDLPATTLNSWCYYGMFNGCSSLPNAPVLPATTMKYHCYAGMFGGCTSLVTAPSLPATTLSENCYWGMFNGCTSLINTPVLSANTLAAECYRSMFEGCTSLVTAPSLPATTLAGGCYIRMFWSCTSLVTAPSLPATTLADNCYSNMFNGCTSLTTAPALPANKMEYGCYQQMFEGCTSLVNVPNILPATTLDTYCYYRMFYGCTSLVTAPSLPATTLTYRCYKEMFYGCISLNYIKALFKTTPSGSSPYYYTQNWVYNVADYGTFVKNSAATWDVSGNNGIPYGWTIQTASE